MRLTTSSGGCALEVTLAEREGRYRVTRLTVEGDDITGELLRTLALGRLVRSAVLGTVAPRSDDGSLVVPLGHRPSDDFLRSVITVYSEALLVGNPATMSVAERFSVSRATAGRWIAAARERHILGPALRAKAGATPA